MRTYNIRQDVYIIYIYALVITHDLLVPLISSDCNLTARLAYYIGVCGYKAFHREFLRDSGIQSSRLFRKAVNTIMSLSYVCVLSQSRF